MAECPDIAGCEEGGLRLVLQALSSGPQGTLAALRAMQRVPGPIPWKNMTDRLCMEVPILGPNGDLIMKPSLLLLPKQSQRNLFSFLNVAAHLVPSSCLRSLAEAILLNKNSSDEWLQYLSGCLLRDKEMQISTSSPQVAEQLQFLCKGLCQNRDQYSKLGWFKQNFTSSRHKRKVHCIEDSFLDGDDRPHNKKVCTEELCVTLSNPYISQEEQKVVTEEPEMERQELPEYVKAQIPKLKEILHGDLDTESSNDSFQADLKDLCESCSPEQLQSIFSQLSISQISPQSLLKLCCILHSITPDLSYAHSSALARSLFLEQALSLTAPAPRPILAALSMFCMKYAQAACCILIGPLVLQADTGSVHTDFLGRMVSECLPVEHLPQCFGPVLKIPFCEGSVNVLHMLLEKQVTISRSDFELLLLSMCNAAEMFSKSVMFSKLLLNIMNRNQSMILPSHIGLLANAVNANQTFMKKSLEVVLKKLRDTT
ncbi:Hypothetical predicted protein [Pelobates cultripes]|uniref:Fanconi Anaemia group E protein C-terminal domain-containing protein n=1 Tax=Pelobates cultripes TaxID=61616 RepID=A0AAD1RH13_PELCU|nr:Hypothetical predicted protein [Pelobates cultripes]